MKPIVTIDSISSLHQRLGYAKPKHPLITVIDLTQVDAHPTEPGSEAIDLGFYAIVCKRFTGKLNYGRSYYDFAEGSMMFTAPHQLLSVPADLHIEAGWALYFHPDLLHGTPLDRQIHQYSFFGYDTHEALHISDDEKRMLEDCLTNIQREYAQPVDAHTQRVLVSQIDLLLQYASRFYDRQFLTRVKLHSDLLGRFERLLNAYFEANTAEEHGLPTVGNLAQQLQVSASYLTDLLHKLTGKTTQEWIHLALVERAKALLCGSQQRVSEIAYKLGFEHPSHFTKLFKSRTGHSPREFRLLN